MLMNIIGAYLVFAYLGFAFTKITGITKLESYKKLLAIFKVNLNFILFTALFILTTHFISFLTNSLKLSMPIAFIVLAIAVLVTSFIKKDEFNFQEDYKVRKPVESLIFIAFSFAFACNYFFKDLIYLGSWDRVLHAYGAASLENNFYPPMHPNNVTESVDIYHYGTSVFSSWVQWLSQAEIVVAMGFVLALCFFTGFLAASSFVSLFVSNVYIAGLLAIFVLFFTSFNSLEFLMVHFPKIDMPNKFSKIVDWASSFSNMSVKSLAKRMSYYGWSIGVTYFFALLNFVFIWFEEKKKTLIPIFLLSFALYFTYPPFWFPLLAGILGWLFFELISGKRDLKESFKTGASVLLVAYFSKFITFTRSMTEIDGMHFMKFDPSWTSSMWQNIGYWKSWIARDVIAQYATKYHHYGNRYFLEIPLFSGLALREFLLITIIATIMFLYLLFRKELKSYAALYVSGIVSLAMPYLFEYTIRPIEMARFFTIGKTFILLFIVCFLARFFKKMNLKTISLVLVIVVLSLPGLRTLWVLDRKAPPIAMPRFSQEEQDFIAAARKIHKHGEVALEDTFLTGLPQTSSYAGFFSYEGEYMKLPLTTRQTACATLNPFLLKEMRIDYLFVSKNSEFVDLDSPRLKDPNLFEKVDIPGINKFVYKFNKNFDEKLYENIRNEYLWYLAYENKTKSFIVRLDNGQPVSASSREELYRLREKLRDTLIEKLSPEVYVWIKPRAYKNPEFKAVK